MAPLVKYLLYKHQGRRSNPQKPCKSQALSLEAVAIALVMWGESRDRWIDRLPKLVSQLIGDLWIQ